MRKRIRAPTPAERRAYAEADKRWHEAQMARGAFLPLLDDRQRTVGYINLDWSAYSMFCRAVFNNNDRAAEQIADLYGKRVDKS